MVWRVFSLLEMDLLAKEPLRFGWSVFRMKQLLRICLVLCFSFNNAFGCINPVAKVVALEGGAEVQGALDLEWHDVKVGRIICRGQVVRILAKSHAVLQLAGGEKINLDEKTTMAFDEARFWPSFLGSILSYFK